MPNLCCCCQRDYSDDDDYKTPRIFKSTSSGGNYCAINGDYPHSSSSPPLLDGSSTVIGFSNSAAATNTNTNIHHSSVPPPTASNTSMYTPTSPRTTAVRNRHSNSANEYVSHVVNLCQIGCGSFAVVSLVIDKNVLATLRDNDSALAAFFAVKRISKRHEASRLAPGEGGAHAERHTHAMLEHPFFPVLYNASRSSRDFYIAFPFALGADLSKALSRRVNFVRGFGREQAAQLHAQAQQAGATLQVMRELLGGGGANNNNNNNNNGNNNNTNSGPNSLGQTVSNSLNNNNNSSSPSSSSSPGASASKGMGRKSRSGSENEDLNGTNMMTTNNTTRVKLTSTAASIDGPFNNNNNNSNKSNSQKSSPRSSKSSPQNSQNHFSINHHAINEIRATNTGLPISFVCVVAFELLSAIAFLNERGYTHYDIRPGNLLLVNGGHVILGDFGMIRDESPVKVGGINSNNNDPMNSIGGDSSMNNESKDHSAFSKFFNALMGKNPTTNESCAGPSSQNGSFSYANNNNNNNASFGNASFGNPHQVTNGNGNTSNFKSPSKASATVTDTSNEKRSQLYLAPEHLSSATNIEAENDCKRLSDVWSYGVLLMELALGAHPFTPQQQQHSDGQQSSSNYHHNDVPASAFAMLTSIKKMVWRRVPTSAIDSDHVATVVELLNDLVSAIFVPRDKRPSASSLMNHPFFANSQVRALVGISDDKQGANLNNPQFFGRVVNQKKLVGAPSLDPAKVCRKGGCPTARELREWLSVLAPCPQHIAPDDFAPTLEMSVFEDDDNEDSRDLIDLRFFGSLSDDDLLRWNRDDNDHCLRIYDSEWCPSDMACSRAHMFSSHNASSLAGQNHNNQVIAAALPDYDVVGNEEVIADHHHHHHHHHHMNGHGRGKGRHGHHHRQKSGGGNYYNHGGEVEAFGGMSERPGFTFVRPSIAMMNGEPVY